VGAEVRLCQVFAVLCVCVRRVQSPALPAYAIAQHEGLPPCRACTSLNEGVARRHVMCLECILPYCHPCKCGHHGALRRPLFASKVVWFVCTSAHVSRLPWNGQPGSGLQGEYQGCEAQVAQHGTRAIQRKSRKQNAHALALEFVDGAC